MNIGITDTIKKIGGKIIKKESIEDTKYDLYEMQIPKDVWNNLSLKQREDIVELNHETHKFWAGFTITAIAVVVIAAIIQSVF